MAPGLGREAGFTAKGIREIGGIAETTGVCDEIDRDGGVFKQAFRSNKTLADGSVVVFLPDVPKSEAAWRETFLALGARPLVKGFDYVRRHGDLVMFHTANAGEHTLVPPDDLAGKDATELFSGRVFSGAEFRFKTEGCDTLLLKFAGNDKPQ